MKMDSQQRRKKEKQASKELTSSYLQPKGYDDYDDEVMRFVIFVVINLSVGGGLQ